MVKKGDPKVTHLQAASGIRGERSGGDDQLRRTLQELRHQRRRLEDFARATSDWFWETDGAGHLVYLSNRMTALCGIPAATMIGRRLEDIGRFPAEPGQPTVKELMKKRKPFRDRLFEFSSARGERLTFHLAGVPVFDPATGVFSGYRGAGFDMTPRYKAERATEEARLELEKALEDLTNKNVEADFAAAQLASALKERSEFIASLSHELRTPLNAIIGFAEAMAMQVFGPMEDRYQQYSQDIVGAARHLLALINDILDQAAMESGHVRVDTRSVSLGSVIDEAVALVRLRAETKGLDLQLDIGDKGLAIDVDPKRAKQILVNLLSNAVKFTPESGRIGLEAGAGDEGFVAVTIWDTGIGIPTSEHDKVFERFEQVTDDEYARQQEGTGLGLAISRDLARMMGGDIALDSSFGSGSRFTVTFPLAKDGE
jgi:PAS domain S-box-containing protein